MTERTNAPRPAGNLSSTELSGTDFRWIARAIQQAEKSRMRVRVGALVVVAGRATVGHNKYRNPPRLTYSEASVHAEVSALRRAPNGGAGGTAFIARLGRTGRLLPSFPCQRCLPRLHEAGIKRVVWWDGYRWVSTKMSSLIIHK